MKQDIPFFITITSEVLRDKDLNPIEKLIFTEIMALTYSCGYCYANNSHFAEIFDRTPETISRNIAKLQSKGFIYSEITQSDGNKRKIYVKYTGNFPMSKTSRPLVKNDKTSCQKHQDPLDKNVKHSNTVSNSNSKSLSNKHTASGLSQSLQTSSPSKQNQFQEFYNLYNHKVKKPNAETQFKKALSKASFQEIMDGAKKYQEWLDLEKINFPTKQKQAPDVWLKSERWADDYTSLIAVEKDKIKSSGKTVPVPQKSPEKVQEEVNYKKTLQSKRKAIVELLNENERNFLIHIQGTLKGMFSPPHYPWIDNMVFHCNRNATFSFMEQKHLDAIKINQEKFEGIARRELNVTDFKFEKIEIKLIDK